MSRTGGNNCKEPTCQCRRLKRCRFIPWLGRSPRGGHGNALQYSCLEDPMDREAWQARVGLQESDTAKHACMHARSDLGYTQDAKTMLGKCEITANTFQKSLILSPQVEYSHILRPRNFTKKNSFAKKNSCLCKQGCLYQHCLQELKSGGPSTGDRVDKLWQSHAMNVSSQNNGLLNNTA